MLSQEKLKKILNYDPITGIFTRVVSTNPKNKVGEIAGTLYQGYNVIKIDGTSYQAARLAFLFIQGEFPKFQVDHINHIRNDDSWSNLREVSQQTNSKNRRKYKTNATGEGGITKSGNKFRVQLQVEGKRLSFGSHSTLEQAVAAREEAKTKFNFHKNHSL